MDNRKCYGAWINDAELRLNSSSGGMFSAIAIFIFSLSGIVYAVEEEKNNLQFRRTVSLSELNNMHGSKYYQANITNFDFIQLFADIDTHQPILIIGLPCQIGMFYSIIFHKYKTIPENIILVDLICHGVSSNKFITIYRTEIEHKYGELRYHKFRTKEVNQYSQYSSYSFKNKHKVIVKNEDDYFMRLFSQNEILRPSCYNCRYAGGKKYSDITIGDFNGAYKFISSIPSSIGSISAVIVNTIRGEKVIAQLVQQEIITAEKTKYEDIATQNFPLLFPSKRPKGRKYAFTIIEKIGFINACRLLSAKYYLKKIIQKVGGDGAVKFIKKLLKRPIIEN